MKDNQKSIIKINMNMNRITSNGKIVLSTLVVAGTFLASCNKDNVPVPGPDSGKLRVKAEIVGYSGAEADAGEDGGISSLQACVFDGGRMTQVYDNINVQPGGLCEISLDSRRGTLYMVADADGLLDLNALQSQGISEEDWLKTTISSADGNPVHFLSGSVSLDGSGSMVPLKLRRGFARFDLKVRAAGVAEINSVSLKNVAASAYLFPVDGKYSPDGAPVTELKAEFGSPLTEDTAGVLHVHEQPGNTVMVSVDAVIDGKPVVLEKELSEPLERNTVYTVTVRKDDIDVSLDVTLEDWQQGGDTELMP